MTQPVQGNVPSFSVGEAIKLGFFFPFRMDKAKFMVMLELIALMTLGTALLFKAIFVLESYMQLPDYSMPNPMGDTDLNLLLLPVGYVLVLWAMVSGHLYAMQCGGLGGTSHLYLGQILTSVFWRSILLGVLFALGSMVYLFAMIFLAKDVSGGTLFVTVPLLFALIGLFVPLFPHVAMKNKIALKHVLGLARRHVHRVLGVLFGIYALILVLMSAVVFGGTLSLYLAGVDFQMLGLSPQNHLLVALGAGLYMSCITWLLSGMYAALAHLWRGVLENEIPQAPHTDEGKEDERNHAH